MHCSESATPSSPARKQEICAFLWFYSVAKHHGGSPGRGGQYQTLGEKAKLSLTRRQQRSDARRSERPASPGELRESGKPAGRRPGSPAARLAAPAGDSPPQPEKAPIKNINADTRALDTGPGGGGGGCAEEGVQRHPARNGGRGWRERGLACCFARPAGSEKSLPGT